MTGTSAMTGTTGPVTGADAAGAEGAGAEGADGARRLVREALARARSGDAPGPDTPAGRARPELPGPPLPVPARVDRVLRHALAGTRFRPAASAGGLHPVDTHLLLGSGCGLPPGRYAYDPARHRLHRLHRRGGGAVPVGGAPDGAVAVLTAVARRTVSHYGHRAWPLVLLDLGHAAAALALAGAPAVSLDAPGALLSAALGGRVAEPALAAARLTPGTDAGALLEWAAGGTDPGPGGGVASAGERSDLASARAVLGVLAAAGGSGRPTWCAAPAPLPGHVLLGRRSAEPGFTGVPDADALACLLAAAGSGPGRGPGWCLAVGGPEPGLLALAPGGTDGGPDGGPDGGLVRVAHGEVLPTLALWGARQGWIAAAGAVLLAHGCPDDAPPERVRREHLAAGYGVGVAQALATARGLPSRPVGSWQDADLGAALGDAPGRNRVLHGLALGRTFAPHMSAPHMSAPHMLAAHMSATHTSAPHVAVSHTSPSHMSGRQMSPPPTSGPHNCPPPMSAPHTTPVPRPGDDAS
ncbi:nitroreductase [Streptomyces sp. NPDC005805]|uniref:nitroreductase n=1 Tax=Streptomyces sp. NPDC005805 TaxID=3157068 RepID=UPI0033FDEBC2